MKKDKLEKFNSLIEEHKETQNKMQPLNDNLDEINTSLLKLISEETTEEELRYMYINTPYDSFSKYMFYREMKNRNLDVSMYQK